MPTIRQRLASLFGFGSDLPLLADLAPHGEPVPQLPAVQPGRRDAIASAATGFGTVAKDRRLSLRPAPPPSLSDGEIEAETYDGIMRRLIESPVSDALSIGWRLDLGGERDAGSKATRTALFRARLLMAAKCARWWGGAHLVAICEGDRGRSERLREPLTGRQRVVMVQVATAREATPATWDEDPASEGFGGPLTWWIQWRRDGPVPARIEVHRSRMFQLHGAPVLPDQQGRTLGYDASYADIYFPMVRDLEWAFGSAADAGATNNIMILRIAAHAAKATAATAPDYRATLSTIYRSLTGGNIAVMSGEDEMTRLASAMAGIGETLDRLWQPIQAVEGIPHTRITGQQVAGLGNSDAPGSATYDSLLDGLRTDYAEAILWLDAIERGDAPADRTIEWIKPDPSAKTQAETDLLRSQRDVALVTAQIITPEEARARYLSPDVLDYPVVVGAVPPDLEEEPDDAEVQQAADDLARLQPDDEEGGAE